MKRADATLLKRYAAVRLLRARELKRRWAALTADTRRTLRAEMQKLIAAHDAALARKAANKAFEGALP